MNKKIIYRNILNKVDLCYQETKRINSLLLKNISEEELKELVYTENILQLPSIDLRRKTFNEVTFRLEALESAEKLIIHEEDVQSSKCLVLYAVLKVDLLFRSFSRAVLLEKLLTYNDKLEKKEVVHYIELQLEKEGIEWSSGTIQKLAGSYLRVFTEANMVSRQSDGTYEVRRPIISLTTENYLRKEGFSPAAEVVLGELL